MWHYVLIYLKSFKFILYLMEFLPQPKNSLGFYPGVFISLFTDPSVLVTSHGRIAPKPACIHRGPVPIRKLTWCTQLPVWHRPQVTQTHLAKANLWSFFSTLTAPVIRASPAPPVQELTQQGDTRTTRWSCRRSPAEGRGPSVHCMAMSWSRVACICLGKGHFPLSKVTCPTSWVLRDWKCPESPHFYHQ